MLYRPEQCGSKRPIGVHFMEKTTVTQSQIVDFLAERHGLSKTQATRVIHSLVDYFSVSLSSGHCVRLSGLGVLDTHLSAARMARNIRTGETVEIPEKRRIRFRPSVELKRAINKV
ncbi:HU family DNA-binding protein [Acidithiobacillus sp.]|uniref:HU family DNA-binding protein n=1 Tax=Acidithiobacillus sp. TaxID=1872118 RepID=UPI003D02F171